MADPDTLLIEIERIRSVFQQARVTLSVTVINAILTVLVLAPVANHRQLTIWTIMVALVSGARWAIRLVFFRRRPEAAQSCFWAVVSVLGSLTTGVLWGGGALVLCPAVEMYQLFLAFVIGGMCAGATTVNSAHLPTLLAFIIPASLPLAGSFLTNVSLPENISALMVIVFATSLSVTGLRAHQAFGERMRLQLAVQRQQRALTEANDRLRQEISERRNVEASLQQAQKMEAIGHLTGGIAHDFNNLLQVVIGNMDLIRRLSRDNPRILDYASAASLAAGRGAQLTSSLLAFARRQTLRAEWINLNAEVRAFQQIIRRALGEKIHFTSILQPDLPACYADSTHLQSAILNLVINARDAMPDGGRLSITTGVANMQAQDLLDNPDAKPGRFVMVAVQDSGTGMTETLLAKAFEPFFTTKETGKGSGLGLSQVFGFVRQSGGHVRLQSTPGAGTCATLFLPAPKQPGKAQSAEQAAGETQPIDLRGVTMLVVDDDPDVLKVVATCLLDAGCLVKTAHSARQALEMLHESNDIQCLLADVALPGDMTGTELAAWARSRHPDLAVILTTGHVAQPLAGYAAIEAEFPLLRKPFPPDLLLARISAAVGRTRPA